MTFLLTYISTEDKTAHKIIHKATLCSSAEIGKDLPGIPRSPFIPGGPGGPRNPEMWDTYISWYTSSICNSE